MKKALLASAALLVVGQAHTAVADVEVDVLVTKTKTISVIEVISITKDINIVVTVNNLVTKAAEVDSLINQTNFDNESCENCAEKIDEIISSVSGNTGVVTVNQTTGNHNNQGSVLTIAVDDTPPPGTPPDNGNGTGFFGFAEAQGATDQRNSFNLVKSDTILFREDFIANSVNDNIGVVMVNQAAGQMMNEANNVAIAISLDPFGGVALSEADLGQFTTNNQNHESDVLKTSFILDSVNRNQGVTLVNQGTGNLGNQANLLTVAATAAAGSL